MEITAKLYPKKLEPVSPIKVLAGLKLNGKNPVNAPANAVTNKTAMSGESFKAKIIIKDKHEINEIPEDKPSKPSIKLIALVIPIIQPIVIIIENTLLVLGYPKMVYLYFESLSLLILPQLLP